VNISGGTGLYWRFNRTQNHVVLYVKFKAYVAFCTFVGMDPGFKSLTEAIDTTTPAGRMMMQMVGSFAEFEREMIRERTKAGLDAARKEGRIGGRRPKLNKDQRKDIADNVISERKSGAQMARLYNVSEATISRIVAQHRQPIE